MTVLIEPVPEAAIEQLTPRSDRPRRHPLSFILHPPSFILLLLLTLLGGVLRFAYLDRPAIWGDEAATFMRVCWWAWVTSGIAMLGLQTVAAGVIAIELIIVLTARHPQWASFGKLLLTILWLPLAMILSMTGLERRGPGRWLAAAHRTFRWPP